MNIKKKLNGETTIKLDAYEKRTLRNAQAIVETILANLNEFSDEHRLPLTRALKVLVDSFAPKEGT